MASIETACCWSRQSLVGLLDEGNRSKIMPKACLPVYHVSQHDTATISPYCMYCNLAAVLLHGSRAISPGELLLIPQPAAPFNDLPHPWLLLCFSLRVGVALSDFIPMSKGKPRGARPQEFDPNSRMHDIISLEPEKNGLTERLGISEPSNPWPSTRLSPVSPLRTMR